MLKEFSHKQQYIFLGLIFISLISKKNYRKIFAIIIAKRIVDQAWVVWGPLFPREADGWKIGQKRENRRNQGWGVVVRGQHTVTAGARRSRRHQMGEPRLETNDK